MLVIRPFIVSGQDFTWPYSIGECSENHQKTQTVPGDSVYFDLSHAYQVAPTVDMQIRFCSDSIIHSLDFALRYNDQSVTFDTLFVPLPTIQYLYYYNPIDSTLRFTSNSMNPYPADSVIGVVRFLVQSGPMCSGDIFDQESFLNGNACNNLVTDCVINGQTDPEEKLNARFYPNPAHGLLYMNLSEKACIQFFDISGKSIANFESVLPGTALDISAIPEGMYIIRIEGRSLFYCEKLSIMRN